MLAGGTVRRGGHESGWRDPRAVAPLIAWDVRRIRHAVAQGGPVEAAQHL